MRRMRGEVAFCGKAFSGTAEGAVVWGFSFRINIIADLHPSVTELTHGIATMHDKQTPPLIESLRRSPTRRGAS